MLSMTRMRISLSSVAKAGASTSRAQFRNRGFCVYCTNATPATWGWRSMVFLPAPPRVSSKRCECARVGKRRCHSRHGGSIAVSTTGTEPYRTVYHSDHIFLLQTWHPRFSFRQVTHAALFGAVQLLSHIAKVTIDSATYFVGTSEYWFGPVTDLEHGSSPFGLPFILSNG